MTDVNVTWSVLSQGYPYGNPQYSRRISAISFDQEQEKGKAMLDVLVPYKDDYLRALYCDEVIKLLLKSPQRDRILNADPLNTYEKATLQYPQAGAAYLFKEQPTPMRIYTAGDDEVLLDNGYGLITTTCEVDPNTNTITHSFGEETFAISSGLSSHIVIVEGLTLRLQSDFATTDPYKFTHTYAIGARVDWENMLRKAEQVDKVWPDRELRDIWDNDPLWTNRMAAFATAVVELFRRGRRTTTN